MNEKGSNLVSIRRQLCQNQEEGKGKKKAKKTELKGSATVHTKK